MAHQSFSEIQADMQKLAVKIAQERHLPSSNYRDVIRALKKDQLAPDQVMPRYRQTLSDIENILRREHLITLPERPAIIRPGYRGRNRAAARSAHASAAA